MASESIELDLPKDNLGNAGRKPAPEQVRLAAYRIAEQALASLFDQARPSQVTVRLDRHRQGRLRLGVLGGARGFDPEGAPPGPGIATTPNRTGAGSASGFFSSNCSGRA